MRIGIDARLWNESGVGRYTRNLIQNLQVLDKRNSYVLFALSKDYENLKSQISNLKWKIVNANIRWHTLEEQLKFPSIINKENLDLMHFPYFSVPVFYHKPYVVTIHDLILNHFPTGLASTVPLYLYKLKLFGYRFVIKRAAQNAKKIITVSNATKNEIINHLKVDSSKVVVTYEGVDKKLKTMNKELRTGRKFSSKSLVQDSKFFLYVGNAYPHKNLDRLLEAFSLLCHPERSRVRRGEAEGSPDVLYNASWDSSQASPDQNDIRLVFVGKEDYFYKRLKEKVKRMNLEKSVLFCGQVSDEELAGLYKNALALVMPSLMEGFGLPVLEAMANKCLVLASEISSLKEICGNAAVYFDPFNIEDIAQKMITALHHNDTYHYSDNIKKGFERAKMFSWKKMGKETLRLYESCFAY